VFGRRVYAVSGISICVLAGLLTTAIGWDEPATYRWVGAPAGAACALAIWGARRRSWSSLPLVAAGGIAGLIACYALLVSHREVDSLDTRVTYLYGFAAMTVAILATIGMAAFERLRPGRDRQIILNDGSGHR
jgi:peptidoglycan/LPS O-acetylase OafA/YrhL